MESSIHVSHPYGVVLIVYTGNEDTAARQGIKLPLQSPDSKDIPCFGYVVIYRMRRRNYIFLPNV